MRGNFLSIDGDFDVPIPYLHLIVSFVFLHSGVWAILQIIFGVKISLIKNDILIEISKSVAYIELRYVWLVSNLETYPISIDVREEWFGVSIVALKVALSKV